MIENFVIDTIIRDNLQNCIWQCFMPPLRTLVNPYTRTEPILVTDFLFFSFWFYANKFNNKIDNLNKVVFASYTEYFVSIFIKGKE